MHRRPLRSACPALPLVSTLLVGGAARAEDASAPSAAEAACDVRALGEGEQWIVGYGLIPYEKKRALAEAQTAALAAAEADLRAKACANRSAADCDRIMTYQYKAGSSPFVDVSARTACAVYGIPRRYMDRSPLLEDAEKGIDALAGPLKAAVAGGDGPVAVEPFTTEGGCAVPELSGAAMRVQNGLGVALVDAGSARTDVRRVRLQAAHAGEQELQLSANLVQPAGGGFQTVATARIPRAAYGIAQLGEGRCITDERLGVPGGHRTGPSGERIELALRAPDDATPDTLCQGQKFEVHLGASAPVRVHLYSVEPSGTAYHIWPDLAGSGRIAGTQRLGDTFVAEPLPTGDERLVAIAVPEGAPIGPLDGHRSAASGDTGICRLDRLDIPPGTAVATATWRIETRPERCSGVTTTTASREEIAATLARIPACPAR